MKAAEASGGPVPFVVDASIAASWLLPDEARSELSSNAFAALDRDRAIVPAVWWFEVRNTLIVSERRKRISQQQTDMALSILARCPIDIDSLPGERWI